MNQKQRDRMLWAVLGDIRLQPLKIEGRIIMNHAELGAGLKALEDNLAQFKADLVTRIAALQAAVDGADNVPQEIVDEVTKLSSVPADLEAALAPPTPPAP
jgi:hypothetical protein